MCMMNGYLDLGKGKRTLTQHESELLAMHFSKKITEEIDVYVTNVLMKDSRYLFLTREKKQQFAYCTHCKTNMPVEGLKHKEDCYCRNCNSKCTAISAGLGRSRMIDHARFTYYEKSAIDPSVLVARSIYVVRDYRKEYRSVENMHTVDAWYIFNHGHKPQMIVKGWRGEAEINATTFSYYAKLGGGVVQKCPEEAFKRAIEGTPFQYSCWDQIIYRNWGQYKFEDDLIDYMAFYCERPQVEYFIKAGLAGLVKKKINGESLKRTVNWNAKTLEKALGMTKQEFKELKSLKNGIDVWPLLLFKKLKKEGWKLTAHQVFNLSNIVPLYSLEDFIEMTKVDGPIKLFNYFEKQFKISKKRHCNTRGDVFRDYRDYLVDCKKLNYDLSDEVIRLPQNLNGAHIETIKRIKHVADEKLKGEFLKRAKELKKFEFKSTSLFIRPVLSSSELIEEGVKLKHCVGGYSNSHVLGTTSIMVIRTVKEPNKPLVTVEMRNGMIVQARGYKNYNPTPEVQEFIDSYKEKVLSKNENKKKPRRRLEEGEVCRV